MKIVGVIRVLWKEHWTHLVEISYIGSFLVYNITLELMGVPLKCNTPHMCAYMWLCRLLVRARGISICTIEDLALEARCWPLTKF
jgi:hypothetical protein